MDDLFSVEQKVFDNALSYSKELKNGAALDPDKFRELAGEYGRLLRLVRTATKISDRTTIVLHTSKADLLDKVHHDVLTGIYNRRFMEEFLKRIVKVSARSGDVLSVMMLDIDFFKKYNDTYGHSAGDACLKAVAQTISGCLSRADDFVARYGGEEFVVILPSTGENGARFMANKILGALRERNIPHAESEVSSRVTVSIGVTTITAVHANEGDNYIKCADTALYQSKQNGRNRYTFMDYRNSHDIQHAGIQRHDKKTPCQHYLQRAFVA